MTQPQATLWSLNQQPAFQDTWDWLSRATAKPKDGKMLRPEYEYVQQFEEYLFGTDGYHLHVVTTQGEIDPPKLVLSNDLRRVVRSIVQKGRALPTSATVSRADLLKALQPFDKPSTEDKVGVKLTFRDRLRLTAWDDPKLLKTVACEQVKGDGCFLTVQVCFLRAVLEGMRRETVVMRAAGASEMLYVGEQAHRPKREALMMPLANPNWR